MLSLCGSFLVHLFPIPKSNVTHKPNSVTTASLVERVAHFLKIFEVKNSVSRHLFPRGLSCDHQVGVVEEEQSDYDHRDKGHHERHKYERVHCNPLTEAV